MGKNLPSQLRTTKTTSDKESKGGVTIGCTMKKCFVDGERHNCDRSRSKVGGVPDLESEPVWVTECMKLASRALALGVSWSEIPSPMAMLWGSSEEQVTVKCRCGALFGCKNPRAIVLKRPEMK